MAGFDGEDRCWARDQFWVCEREGGSDIDDGTDAHARNDVGEGEEVGWAGDGKDVIAWREGLVVEMIQDVFYRLNVDEFLCLNVLDDLNGEVETGIVPVSGEIGETGGEEGGFEILEEIDALEVGDCGVGNVRWRGAVWGTAAGIGYGFLR